MGEGLWLIEDEDGQLRIHHGSRFAPIIHHEWPTAEELDEACERDWGR